MDRMPDNPNYRRRTDDLSALPVKRHIDPRPELALLNEQNLQKSRAALKSLLHSSDKTGQVRNEVLDPYRIDLEGNGFQRSTVSFLRDLSDTKLSSTKKRKLLSSFMKNGVFQNEENRLRLSAFLKAILKDGQASFFRDNNIDKETFLKFVLRARKLEPNLLSDLMISTDEPALENLILLVDEVGIAKKPLLLKLINNLIDVEQELDDQEMQALMVNFNKFFHDKPPLLKNALRKIVEDATEEYRNLQTSVANVAIDLDEKGREMFIQGVDEDDDDGSLLSYVDDPQVLYESSKEIFYDRAQNYHHARQRAVNSHDVFKRLLNYDPDSVTKKDLEALFDIFSSDLEAIETLEDAEFESFDILQSVDINLFAQKSYNRFQECMAIVDDMMPEEGKVSLEDQFEVLGDLFADMSAASHLNSDFNLTIAAKLFEIDSARANNVFLKELERSPYALSYDNLSFMISTLADEVDPAMKKQFQELLRKEYLTQAKFQPHKRTLPMLFALIDYARDQGNTISLARFISGAKVDFKAMFDMLENTHQALNEAKEENEEYFDQQFDEYGIFDDAGIEDDEADFMINKSFEELPQVLLDVVTSQVSRRRDLKDDFVTRKLVHYLAALSKDDPEKVLALKGKTKQFIDIQAGLADKT